MATAKQFLETIERQKLVSDALIDELYEEYRKTGGAVTADELAKRLVASGAITPAKADVLLQPSSDSFIQLGSGVLSPKSSSAIDPADPFQEELETKKAGRGEERDAAGRRKHVKKTHKNDFDSPLLLIGGGVLALLVLGGVGLLLVMNLQSGDQLLESAQALYASGSYSQARDEYEQFVEDFEGNARWSEARVKLAVVRLRQLVETDDWRRALEVAQEEIPQVEDEPAFAEFRGEFASLLPRVAAGLAAAADRASESIEGEAGERVASLVDSAEAALTLVNNTKYVPKSLRDDGEITGIRELLQRVERRREAVTDLAKTLESIRQATDAGDVSKAYAEHAAFVRRRPELRDDARLAEALAAAVEAERQLVKFVADPTAASSDEAPSPVSLALPLADPRRTGDIEAPGVFATAQAGVVYAVNAADGAPRWRRPVGESLAETPPVMVGDELLLIDHRRGELVRTEAATGDLVWRVAVEAPAETQLYRPVAAGESVLVATDSGRLWAFDAAGGARTGYAQFAQPLRCPPAADAERGKVYVVGEQSSLYTLEAASLECVAVAYSEHSAGAVVVPPIAVAGRVLLLENTGSQTSRLSLFATDDAGTITNRIGELRLEGIVSTPASVAGRRVVVTTESGAVTVLEVSGAAEGQPLTVVATQSEQPGAHRRQSAVEAQGEVWIAGEGLRRTAASLASPQLVVRELRDACDKDLFTGALERRGRAVLHARLRNGATGVTLAAHDASTGRLVWETDFATPPAGPPVVSAEPRGVVAVGVDGQTHVLGAQAIRARLSAEPTVRPTRPAVYDSLTRTADGSSVLARTGAAEWLAVQLSPRSASRGATLPGELACRPASMGAGVVTPLSVGQVHLLGPSGQQLAVPFQPPVAVGSKVAWTPPGVGEAAGEPVVLLTDGKRTVYCLGLSATEPRTLALLGSAELTAGVPTTAAAVVGGNGFVGLASKKLAVLALPGMASPMALDLPGDVVWGPFAAGDLALVATEEQLVAVAAGGTPRILWTAKLTGAVLVGEPLVDDDGVLVAARDGRLLRHALADGRAAAPLDLGEPLGSGPTAYGPRLLIAAADGTVLVVNKP